MSRKKKNQVRSWMVRLYESGDPDLKKVLGENRYQQVAEFCDKQKPKSKPVSVAKDN